MTSLIKNELIKIFKKKTIYITLILVLAFVIFDNIMYKYVDNNYQRSYFGYSEEYLNSLKEELKDLDPNKISDNTIYIDIKLEIDTAEISNKYPETDWKQQIISQNVATLVRQKNEYQYGIEKDEEKAKDIQNQIEKIEQKLNEDDWKYFANEELQNASNNLTSLENQKSITEDKQAIESLERQIENAKIDKEVAEYRINKNIKYGNDYMNQALQEYQTYAKTVNEAKSQKEELSYEEKQQYNNNLKNMEINKYILESEIDVNKRDSLKGMLQNFYNEFGIFIIVIIVMIAGTIVSEEFNKGTIKLLLVKPYSRKKILLSKFFASIIILIFTIITILIMQLLVGGILFGFDTLKEPVIEYNFNTQQIQSLNVFEYIGIQTLAQLPMMILLLTLAFAISTIFANNALAITIALLGYMSTMIINQLIIIYNIKPMQYFVTMNWDLSQYLFGGLPYMQGMTMPVSIIVDILYLAIMLIPTLIIFKRKNIKNI